jgi:hypothetical protein
MRGTATAECVLVSSVLTHEHPHVIGARRNRAFSPRRPLARTLPRQREEPGEMSQKTVQLVIGRLVTDEELRLRFVERPLETLGELREQGFELSEDEIDALARSDAEMWPAMARRIHPRLQRCSLRGI